MFSLPIQKSSIKSGRLCDMEHSLISIIIPAYNVGKYIAACLDSLYAQTHQNFEIIVAYDEKSTDNTLEVLQSYAAEKDNLIIDIGIDKGSGDARNRGFILAKGDFILFVDGDDEVTTDYLSTMLSVFEQHPELNVVLCNYLRLNEDEVQEGFEKANASVNEVTLIPRDEMLYRKLWHEVSSAPWSYLIRREYLVKNNIVFPPYSHADDSLFTYKLTVNSEHVGYCSKILYLFIQHDTSITHVLPDYWWRKYEPFARDMVAYFSEKEASFAVDFERNIYRILAYMSARRLSYKDFLAEMNHFDVKKLANMEHNDRFFVQCSAWCFNVSKRLYWCMVRLMNSMINKFSPLTQR